MIFEGRLKVSLLLLSPSTWVSGEVIPPPRRKEKNNQGKSSQQAPTTPFYEGIRKEIAKEGKERGECGDWMVRYLGERDDTQTLLWFLLLLFFVGVQSPHTPHLFLLLCPDLAKIEFRCPFRDERSSLSPPLQSLPVLFLSLARHVKDKTH